jgi:ferredoxin
MPYVITNECINCRACEIECPVEAINEPIDKMTIEINKSVYISYEHFYIDEEKCDECILFSKPKCADICPMDAIKKV